jgi:MFS superfamily sulfate permease-like transporter
MIVLVPGLFKNLPQPALAAVVITASLSLADPRRGHAVGQG